MTLGEPTKFTLNSSLKISFQKITDLVLFFSHGLMVNDFLFRRLKSHLNSTINIDYKPSPNIVQFTLRSSKNLQKMLNRIQKSHGKISVSILDFFYSIESQCLSVYTNFWYNFFQLFLFPFFFFRKIPNRHDASDNIYFVEHFNRAIHLSKLRFWHHCKIWNEFSARCLFNFYGCCSVAGNICNIHFDRQKRPKIPFNCVISRLFVKPCHHGGLHVFKQLCRSHSIIPFDTNSMYGIRYIYGLNWDCSVDLHLHG